MMQGGAYRQQGVALLTVVLIVSVVTILATAMANRQHIDIRRSANMLSIDQLYQYASAAELLAIQGLWEDRNDNEFDTPDELWAVPVSFEVEGGSISGHLVDLDRYININNLLDVDGNPDPVEIERMRRLFNIQGVDSSLVDGLIDWLDEDQQVSGMGGAEDSDYLLADPPYRAANRFMLSISELALVKGFDESILEELQDDDGQLLLTALPNGSRVNVNSAPWQVIAASLEGMTQADAQSLADEEYNSHDLFMQDPLVNQAANAEQISAKLNVSSEYFLLSGLGLLGNREQAVYSVLQRDNSTGISVVIYRSQGVY